MQKPTRKTFKDVEGHRFDRWLVLEYRGRDSTGGATWLCRCDCGNEKVVTSRALHEGSSRSCGCIQRESAKETGKTLHLRRRKFKATNGRKTHGMSRTPEYQAWNHARIRCSNPNVRNYADYGGRGIRMCDGWFVAFESFLADMGRKPSPKHSLDRIENDPPFGYTCGKCPDCEKRGQPLNCRWATDAEQRFNSRHPKKFLYEGEFLSVSEIARRTGIKVHTLRQRLVVYQWTVEKATTQDPKMYHNRKE